MRARSIGSPAFVLLAALAALAAGVRCDGGTRACTQGTLFVTVTFGGATRNADQVSVDVIIDGGAPKTNLRGRAPGALQDTLEIEFPNGIRLGRRVEVLVTALMNGSAIGTGMATVAALPAGCAALTVALAGGTPAGGGGTGGGGAVGGAGGTGPGGGSGGGTGAGGSVGGQGGTGGNVGGRGGTGGSVGGRGGTGGSVGGRGGTGGSIGGRGGTGGNVGGRGGTGGSTGGRGGGVVVSNRNFDLLFLIDDSSSMRLAQANIERSFPAFMTRLRTAPLGLPNIHVAVISSDMGAGDGSVASCDTTGGKQGIFQYTPRGTCSATGLQAGSTYISDIAGTRNYTGALENVFTCIAALGETGCGFEHQFAAVLRSLGADGRAAPAENQGFLRPDAYLGVIMVTNEDDCSATPGVPLFDTGSNTNIASQLGPPANFRCGEFGHLCDSASGTGMHPSRLAPNNNMSAMVSYTNCRSNDTEGYLLSALDVANRLKALKSDPSQVLVAAITGSPTPYTVTWRAPSTADTSCGAASCPWPVIAHSCTAADSSFADPSVRVSDFVGHFGSNGLRFSICGDIGAAMQSVADKIISLM